MRGAVNQPPPPTRANVGAAPTLGLTELDGLTLADAELLGLTEADGLTLAETELLGLREADGDWLRLTLLEGLRDRLAELEGETEAEAEDNTSSIAANSMIGCVAVHAVEVQVSVVSVAMRV